MNKHLAALGAAVTALAVHASASAQQAQPTSLYGEVGVVSLGVKGSLGSSALRASPWALSGTLGYQLHPNLSIEGFGAFGLGSDDIKLDGVNTGASAKIGTAFGVFLRPSVKLGESTEVFARAGFLRSTLKVSESGVSASESDSDFAYGFGVNIDLSPTSYVQGSWGSYYDKDGLTIRGIGLSYGRRF